MSTEVMNVVNECDSNDCDAMKNVTKRYLLLQVDSTGSNDNESHSNTKNDDSFYRSEGAFSEEDENKLIPSSEDRRENHHFSFLLKDDNNGLGSSGNSRVYPCSCSSSSSSTTTTIYASVSTDDNRVYPCSCSSSLSSTTTTIYASVSTDDNSKDNFRDHDGVNNNDCADDTLQERPNAGLVMFGQSAFKNISEFAIARSRIATEAASEALRRKNLNSSNPDSSLYTIASVGRGSSAADAIQKRDERSLWKQGYDKECDDDGYDGNNEYIINNGIPNHKIEFDFPTASIAEQAAALGLLKQQQRRERNKESVGGNHQNPNDSVCTKIQRMDLSLGSTKNTTDADIDTDNYSSGATMGIKNEAQTKYLYKSSAVVSSMLDDTGTTSTAMRVFFALALELWHVSWKLNRHRSKNIPQLNNE